MTSLTTVGRVDVRAGVSAGAYNSAVRDTVAAGLRTASQRVGSRTPNLSFVLLVDGVDPPLADWVAEREIQTVLLPRRRRLLNAGHPAARALGQIAGVEVRIV